MSNKFLIELNLSFEPDSNDYEDYDIGINRYCIHKL